MSTASNIVTRLLEDDELDPKEFIDQSADAKKFDLRPYVNAKDVVRAVRKWPTFAGVSGDDEIGYTIDFYGVVPVEGRYPGEYVHEVNWHAMLELKPGRTGNLVVVYMFADQNGDEWEVEKLDDQAQAMAKAELDPLVRAFIKKLRTVASFVVRTSSFRGESEEDFDPSTEIDRLQPGSKLKVRLVPHERSTIECPSWHVYHPLTDWHLGTVQYAPLQDADKPWAANPEGINNDVIWFATRDEAIRHIERLFVKRKRRVRESDDDFDPKDEADRLTGPITQEQLAAWMTEAGFYDFSFYSQHQDGKPYLEVRGATDGRMIEVNDRLEQFLSTRRLDEFKGRVTRRSVGTKHPAQSIKRDIWFLLPLEHIAPDPSRQRTEAFDPKAYIMKSMPDRPHLWSQLPPGTLVYDEEMWMVVIIGDKEYKMWAAPGPGTYINTTECSPCYAYGRYTQLRHMKDGPIPRHIRILGPQGDRDPWALLKEINDQREKEEKEGADGRA